MSNKKSSLISRTGSQSVTVLTLADRLGVAACTVSAVLAGQAKSRRIGQKTADRILAEAKRLDYVPNGLARGLRSRRSGVIGVVVAGFRNDWAERVLEGVRHTTEPRNCLPLVMSHGWSVPREEQGLLSLKERRVDGIITIPLPECAQTYRRTDQNGTPVIFLGDTLFQTPEIGYVAWDRGPAVRAAVRHLIETGGRRIGFLGLQRETVLSGVRMEAFEQMLAAAGLQHDPRRVAWVRSESDVRREIERLCANPATRIDSLFATDDGLALVALAELNRLGVRVPQDVTVAGLGDLWKSDDQGAGVTTVREPCEEIGALAAQAIFQALEARDAGSTEYVPMQRLVSGAELKIRRTTHREIRNS